MEPDAPLGDLVSGGPARRPDRRRPRSGAGVRLEPVEPERDAGPLWRATNDGSGRGDAVWTYLAHGPYASVEEMHDWLGSLVPSEDPLFLTVHTDDGPSGIVSFMSIDPEMRRIELGNIWYAPRAQRTGANTETTYLLLREAFDELDYRRVEWKCNALNARSRAAAERLGFTFEGVFRKHMVVKGRNRDTAWFSMLDTEWPSARDAFERWLAAPIDARPSLASLRDR